VIRMIHLGESGNRRLEAFVLYWPLTSSGFGLAFIFGTVPYLNCGHAHLDLFFSLTLDLIAPLLNASY
jgi:hypothetical protein